MLLKTECRQPDRGRNSGHRPLGWGSCGCENRTSTHVPCESSPVNQHVSLGGVSGQGVFVHEQSKGLPFQSAGRARFVC